MRNPARESADGIHLLRLPELLLEIAALCQIDRHADEAEHSSFSVANGRGGQKGGEGLSGFSLDEKFARPALAGRAALHDLRTVIAQEWRRCQLLNRFSDGLFSRPAIEIFREFVPEDHDAVWIGGNYGLLYRVQKLGLESYCGLGARPLRDVRHRADYSDGDPGRIARNVASVHHVRKSAVAPLIPVLVAPAVAAAVEDSR